MAGEADNRRHRPLPEPRHAPRVAQPRRRLAKPGTADGTGPGILRSRAPDSTATRTEHGGPR
jgi:hypothetical protein